MHLHIISREVAKARGLPRYFSGDPCKRGEYFERRTSTSACLCPKCKGQYRDNRSAAEEADPERKAAKADRNKRWRADNADWLKNYKREHYIANRDLILECVRQYSAKNRDAKLSYNRRYWSENRDRFSEERRAKYPDRRDQILADRKAYYIENREDIRARHEQYRKENPSVFKVLNAKYRALKKARMPSWYCEFDRFVMEEAFDLAFQRLERTGIVWHVDHMIALRAKLASGLHCWRNIQVIPAKLNLRKRNRMVLTSPGEWIGFIDRPLSI